VADELNPAEAQNTDQTSPPPATPGGGPPEGEAATSALGDALGGMMAVLLRRGRVELGRAAATGRVRLDARMLRRDRDRMYQKLGREVRALVEGGEVTHPGLVRGVERIEELDARIELVVAGMATVEPSEDDISASGDPPDVEPDAAAGE